jgi:hypothetical protein
MFHVEHIARTSKRSTRNISQLFTLYLTVSRSIYN